MDFAKKKAISDEWFTPESAVFPILKYLKQGSIVWCPFDTDESNFVKLLREGGFKVFHSHISEGMDFLEYVPEFEYDYIVSNPPYSLRNKILRRLFDIGKPFAMLMNTNGLFDNSRRWDLFKKNNFTLIYLKGRVNFMKEQGIAEKSAPPFQSAYICSKISEKQIIFEEETEVQVHSKNTLTEGGMMNYKKSEWGTPQEWGVLKLRYKPTGEIKELKLGIRRLGYSNELVFCDAWGYDNGHPTDLNHPDNYEVIEAKPNDK